MKYNKLCLLVGTALVGGFVTAASSMASEMVSEKSPWLVRGRLLTVQPDESSDISPIGGKASIDGAVVPELDISYFFTKNIAAELILAVTPHDVQAKGTSLGNVNLGDVWLLPPTVTVQYHFMPEQKFSPYVGAGINYTVFFNEDPGAMASVKYDDGFGYALQAGADYALDEHWGVNFDVKKLFLSTDVSVNNGFVTADVDIDPWIIGAGFSYRF